MQRKKRQRDGHTEKNHKKIQSEERQKCIQRKAERQGRDRNERNKRNRYERYTLERDRDKEKVRELGRVREGRYNPGTRVFTHHPRVETDREHGVSGESWVSLSAALP